MYIGLNLRWTATNEILHQVIISEKTSQNAEERTPLLSKHTLTASTGIKRVTISKMLLIKKRGFNILLIWSIQVCWHNTKDDIDISKILEKYLLLPINLGRVRRSFVNNVESTILQWERLFISGKHLRESSVFSPASSPQGKSDQRSESLQKAQVLHLRLYKPELPC